MTETPVLEIKRSSTATTQLIVKTVVSVMFSVALIGYAMTSPDTTLRFLVGTGALISLLMLGLRAITLVNSRVPLSITKDQVVIASSAKVIVERSKITGAGMDPKRMQPCLFYNDPEKGHAGPLRLPLRFIEMDHPTLLNALINAVGRAPEATQDQDA